MYFFSSLEFKLMFDIDTLKLNKAERLMYGESAMTHAMVLTGVNLKVSCCIIKDTRYSVMFIAE